ncbi:MAG: hypothetical protein DMG32_01945 [Acidobacteria bacterium]|nr:MAG: hypothetical protein DMG32_01945 [Acidobacteriota bacterium]
MERFSSRLVYMHEDLRKFLRRLTALGGYCTAQQAKSLQLAAWDRGVRGRLRMLARLGFLRRISKYPVVYQVTKATTRLLGRDSSTRRRHTLETVQARLLAVHFYIEARAWPGEFVFKHEEKIRIFTDAGCPLSTLPQRNGKPYVRDYFMFWLPDLRIAIAMIDQPRPDQFVRLRLFLRQFLPVLRSVREQIDLFIVTPDQQRKFAYEKLLRTSRAIHKLGLGSLAPRIKTYSVRPPVPTIIEAIWPKADKYDEIADVADDSDDVIGDNSRQKHVHRLIGE